MKMGGCRDLSLRAHTERPREDAAEVGHLQGRRRELRETNPDRPPSRISHLQNSEKIQFHCFGLPARGILL